MGELLALDRLFSLDREVALVTGGATGIGRAIASALAEAGADIATTVNSRPADELRLEVEAHCRRFAEAHADLATLDAAGAERLLDEVEAQLGPVSILVNNAGTIRRAPAENHPDEDWDLVMRLNLDAAWRLSRAAGRRMLERGRGKILNVASLLAFQGGVRVPAYTASKHALAGLTKALANEWASRGLNVNAIAPGYVRTTNTEALQSDETRNRQILERIPAGRWGEPQDLAGAAVFLCSRASDYVNGHVLAVDGGWLAR